MSGASMTLAAERELGAVSAQGGWLGTLEWRMRENQIADWHGKHDASARTLCSGCRKLERDQIRTAHPSTKGWPRSNFN